MRATSALLKRVVGPFDRYCCGSGTEPKAAYVTAPLIGIGVAPLACSHSGSSLLDHTIAFDRAEADTANITQTNMICVSSFNGLQGLLLGYDLLNQPRCSHPLLNLPTTEVLDATPLFAATKALFGTVEAKHFPIAPGQHLPCAAKTSYQTGPCLLYGALAIAIAERREQNADLFLEDLGTLPNPCTKNAGSIMDTDEAACPDQEVMVLGHLVDAVGRISDNLGVRYCRVFVGFRSRRIEVGEVGSVLTAVPYIRLAKRAVPDNRPETLGEYSVSEWEAAVRPHFLDTKQ